VASRVDGRVVATRTLVGRQVAAGAVLLELDSQEERKHLEREQAQLLSLQRQIELLHREIEAETRSTLEADAGAGMATDEARLRHEEAAAAARLADAEAERAERLHAQRLLAETEYLRLKTEAAKRRAVAEGLKASLSRAGSERASGGSARQARRAELLRLVAELEGQRAESEAAAAAAAEALAKRTLRAPSAGRLAEWADLQVGAFVKEGERVGAVLEPGELKIVAQFEPGRALGRIRAGQRARMRLDGFPWTQYGALQAHVASVAEELRDARVRVELELESSLQLPVELQHGLPGSVVIEVEQVAPAALILRWAGALAVNPSPSPSPSVGQ
jgi:membrane fusion protein (multidrug efflux system)